MKTLHTPVRPSEFQLDSDANPAGSRELALLHARGVFLARLKRIIWTACMDEGPTAEETIRCVELLAAQLDASKMAERADEQSNLSIATRYGEYVELRRRYDEAIVTIARRWAA